MLVGLFRLGLEMELQDPRTAPPRPSAGRFLATKFRPTGTAASALAAQAAQLGDGDKSLGMTAGSENICLLTSAHSHSRALLICDFMA